MDDVTRILNAVAQGDAGAANELLPLVYQELRRLAAAKMASENPGLTFQPAALVHEACGSSPKRSSVSVHPWLEKNSKIVRANRPEKSLRTIGTA